MFPKVFLFSFCFMIMTAAASYALNPQDWHKKSRQRTRRSSSKQTMVAAVRGVDEASDVDPGARNFDAIDKMEKRSFSPEKVAQFMAEGKLGTARAVKQ